MTVPNLSLAMTASLSRRSALQAALALALPAAGCKSKAPLRNVIYVSAEDSGDVVVVSTERAEVVTRVHVGKRPRGIRLGKNGAFLYVTLSGSPRGGPNVDESKLPPAERAADGIGVVDTANLKLLQRFASGQDPETFDLAADGKRLYISNEETAELSVLDLESGKIEHKVAVGSEPEGVTLRPDGKVVYVTSEAEGSVSVVDTDTLSVIARIQSGLRPRSVTFTPDSATAFVANELGGDVSVVDAKQHRMIGSIHIDAPGKAGFTARPMGSVLSPDGRTLYVSTGRGGAVAVIDVAARKLEGLIEAVGARPWGIGISHDGARLFTANGPSDDISIIDTRTRALVKRVKVGGLPWGVAVAS